MTSSGGRLRRSRRKRGKSGKRRKRKRSVRHTNTIAATEGNHMKLSIIGAAFVAFAAVAPLGAQGRNGNQGVPPGQMPPAGMCRVWIDGVPPGRQPRPTDCATARANVPVNGRVIYGSNTGYNNGRYNNQDCTYS